jgi:RNA polymerase sigma factor (sigma-70 family)
VVQPTETCCSTAIPAPLVDGAMPALFHENIAWAEGIARNVHRKLPPSFDLADLEQEARIAHWRRVEAYDPARNSNYRAFAFLAIRGAVLMACRRKAWREATHEPLEFEKPNRPSGCGVAISSVPADARPGPEEAMLAREQRRNVDGPREYRRRQRFTAALAVLAAADADLVRAVLAGADAREFDAATRKRFTKAVRTLKGEIAKGSPSPAEPTAPGTPDPLPREAILAALPNLAPADAYLVRRIVVEGQSVADVAAAWGVDSSRWAARLRETLAGLQSALMPAA